MEEAYPIGLLETVRPPLSLVDPDFGIEAQDLAEDIILPDELPQIFLGIAPCRSSTTAMLRVMTAGDMDSWYQLLKALLRFRMEMGRSVFELPAADKIFIKETIGPYTSEESTFNPLEVLLEAGVDPENITVILNIREALATACSWIQQFAFNADPDVMVDNVVRAYSTVEEIYEQAQDLDIKCTVFDNRVLQGNSAEDVLDGFFGNLGMVYDRKILSDWTELPKMGDPKSRVRFAEEPELYMSKGFHKKALTAHGLTYFPKKMSTIAEMLDDGQVQKLMDGGVFDIYKKFRVQSEKDLELRIPKSTEVDDYIQETLEDK